MCCHDKDQHAHEHTHEAEAFYQDQGDSFKASLPPGFRELCPGLVGDFKMQACALAFLTDQG